VEGAEAAGAVVCSGALVFSSAMILFPLEIDAGPIHAPDSLGSL
jgi:hypothetical protein